MNHTHTHTHIILTEYQTQLCKPQGLSCNDLWGISSSLLVLMCWFNVRLHEGVWILGFQVSQGPGSEHTKSRKAMNYLQRRVIRQN